MHFNIFALYEKITVELQEIIEFYLHNASSSLSMTNNGLKYIEAKERNMVYSKKESHFLTYRPLCYVFS